MDIMVRMNRAPGWSRDADVVRAVQETLARPSVVKAANALSLFGEHAGGWIALGMLGAAVDRPRRREWLRATAQVAFAHGASIAVKRIVGRPRPAGEGIRTLASTYGHLSFPSSHAASTTAAAVAYGRLTGQALAPVLVPPMLLSRLVLGVHYPSDVIAGSALGALVVSGTARKERVR